MIATKTTAVIDKTIMIFLEYEAFFGTMISSQFLMMTSSLNCSLLLSGFIFIPHSFLANFICLRKPVKRKEQMLLSNNNSAFYHFLTTSHRGLPRLEYHPMFGDLKCTMCYDLWTPIHFRFSITSKMFK